MQINTPITWIWILSLMVLSSCAGTRQTARQKHKQDTIQTSIEPIDTLQATVSNTDTSSIDTPQIVPPPTPPATPKARWQTFQTPSATAYIKMGNQDLTVKSQVQVIWDSLLVLSVAPALGIELLRVEATPQKLLLVDKVHKKYSLVSYEEANKMIKPAICYTDLQDICTGVVPTNATNGQMVYRANGQTISLKVKCQQAKVNAPIQINRIDLQRFTRVNLKTLLQ